MRAQLHPFGRHFVNHWSLVTTRSLQAVLVQNPKVAPAQVIAQNENDVWWLFTAFRNASASNDADRKQKCKAHRKWNGYSKHHYT